MNNKEINWNVIVAIILLFIAVFLFVIQKSSANIKEPNLFYIQFLGAFSVIGSIILVVYQAQNKKFENKIDSKVNDVVKSSELKFSKLVNSASISFQTKITSYEKEYVESIQAMVENFKHSNRVENIYAIDYSDPLDWWNDSMTAYLAILTSWKNQDNKNREIHRVFIFNKLDFQNDLTKRTIFFHALLGLKTYFYSYEYFTKLFKTFFTEHNKKRMHEGLNELKPKEFVIWKGSKTEVNEFEEVYGYQSFWSLDEGRNDMVNVKKPETLKVTNLAGEEIDKKPLLFEFLDSEDLKNKSKRKKSDCLSKLPDMYYSFAVMLTNPNSDNLIEINKTSLDESIKDNKKVYKINDEKIAELNSKNIPFGVLLDFTTPRINCIESALEIYKNKTYK